MLTLKEHRSRADQGIRSKKESSCVQCAKIGRMPCDVVWYKLERMQVSFVSSGSSPCSHWILIAINYDCRTIKNGKLRFDGRVEWKKGGNMLMWTNQYYSTEARTTMTMEHKAHFGSGTDVEDEICQEYLREFSAETPERREQFDKIGNIVLKKLWPSLVLAFGHSKYTCKEYEIHRNL